MTDEQLRELCGLGDVVLVRLNASAEDQIIYLSVGDQVVPFTPNRWVEFLQAGVRALAIATGDMDDDRDP